jgi:hypothetical protein
LAGGATVFKSRRKSSRFGTGISTPVDVVCLGSCCLSAMTRERLLGVPIIVPSFIAKISRAKKHLIDLESEIGRFAAMDPYAVSEGVEGKKKRKVRRLVFTADPANTDIPIITADVIYNLRSALDHLMSSLVAPKDRGSAMFPIFFEGVWQAIVPGENEQRIKDRQRWASYIKTLPDVAVTVLKAMQPPDLGAEHPEPAPLT